MHWHNHSIMARRGLSGGKPGQEHVLTKADHGRHHSVHGPFADAVLTVDPGAVATVETHDAFEGAIRRESDSLTAILNFPCLNPQNGPTFVNGAEKGDCPAVAIRDIRPRGPQPCGTPLIMPEFGGLIGTRDTALLHPDLPERVRKLDVTAERGVRWSDRIGNVVDPGYALGASVAKPIVQA